MNVDELLHKLQITEEENKKLQDELIQTKEHLKKYTGREFNSLKRLFIMWLYDIKTINDNLQNEYIAPCINKYKTIV